MKPLVQIVEQSAYEFSEIRRKSREMMEAAGFSVRGKSVFVKPSFVYPARPPLNRAVNTQPEVVGGVVHALRDLGASRVWVGEDCLVGPSQAGFVAMGVLPYLRGAAEPVYLQDEPRVEVKVPEALIEDRFLLPRRFLDADLFVSLPKLKVNMYATVTLSVKNNIGLLLARDRLTNHHYHIHRKIADLYRTRPPDFVIADAVQAGEGQGPMHAEPAPLHVLIGGGNGLAADVVSCALMGYDPAEVAHLRFLHERGLGPLELSEIDVAGEQLLHRRRRLLRPHTDFGDYHRTLNFFVGTERACPEGCVGMIRGSLDRWAQIHRWKPLKGLTFIVGKPHPDLPKNLSRRRTLVIGDCAEPHRELGTFIPGCPIPPMAITYALAKKGINGPLATRLRDLAWGGLAHTLGIPVK